MATDATNEASQRSPPRSPRPRIKSFSVGDLRAHSKGIAPNQSNLLPRIHQPNGGELANITSKGPNVPDIPPLSPTVEKAEEHRVIVVANRLHVTAKRTKEGTYSFTQSAGGLATGMAGVMKKTKLLWYGWIGRDIPLEDQPDLTRRCWEEHGCIPIYVSEALNEGHYNGFSNSILWPLFHYHFEGILFDDSTWEAYQEVNRLFAKTIAQDVKDGDLIWVQDYHLMLLPAMLREELEKRKDKPKNVKIGFFLHCVFPSSEIYRVLPVREEILEGVLQSDLIGFHTIDFVRHFLNACSKVLHVPTTPAGVHYQGRFVAVQEFPIGIDPGKFTDGLKDKDVIKRIAQLKERFKDVKVIVGVDRLDYVKGMQHKLHALEVFLTEHPEWAGKVILIQVAVPSRGDVLEYQNLRHTVNELVGRINGKFGTFEFSPIHFLYQAVDFKELISLYAVSDACLVTSTRDGMNLVSYEYIACQEERHGVMILSEFAGAAQSLNGSIVVNPWDTDTVAQALFEAVTMSEEQRKNNYLKLKRRVNTYTSQWWGDSFVGEILKIAKSAENLKVDTSGGRGSEKWADSATRGGLQVEIMTPSNFPDFEIGKEGVGDVAGREKGSEDDDEEKYELFPVTALPTPTTPAT